MTEQLEARGGLQDVSWLCLDLLGAFLASRGSGVTPAAIGQDLPA